MSLLHTSSPPAGGQWGRTPPAVGEARRVTLVWGALFLNVLAFAGTSVLPIPLPVGQVLTQGALVAALFLALIVNVGGVVRPNVYLVLLSVLAVVSVMVSLHNEFVLGSTFRAVRFLGFVLVLWLLTPWFGRRDMLLLRCHQRVLWVLLGTVLAGAAIAPGTAFAFEGRLSGVLWPIFPTQVGHYAAVLLGTSALLWMCRLLSGRRALATVALTGLVMVLTHTRTALLAMLVALLVATASLFLGSARVRRVSAVSITVAVLLATLFAPQLTAWALRGQSTEDLGQLTGRTKVWSAVLQHSRPRIEEMFGSGLSNHSFNGLPIDNNWLATYLDQGWFGIVMHTVVVLLLLAMAATSRRGPQRAVALFLVVYGLTASFTETGLGAASPYLLDLTVAAALLSSAAPRREP